jgi:hypothetical protein
VAEDGPAPTTSLIAAPSQSTGADKEVVESGTGEGSGSMSGGPAEEEEDAPLTEEEVAQQMSGMTEVQKRLFKIRMKMNQGRKANKTEVRAPTITWTDMRC